MPIDYLSQSPTHLVCQSQAWYGTQTREEWMKEDWRLGASRDNDNFCAMYLHVHGTLASRERAGGQTSQYITHGPRSATTIFNMQGRRATGYTPLNLGGGGRANMQESEWRLVSVDKDPEWYTVQAYDPAQGYVNTYTPQAFLALTRLKEISRGVYSQLPKSLIDHFGTPVNIPNPAKRAEMRYRSPLGQFPGIGEHPLTFGGIGNTVTVIEPTAELLDEYEKLNTKNAKYKCLKYRYLMKAGLTQAQPESTVQTLKQLMSGSRFFLYKTTLNVMNWVTSEFEEVSFIGIATFNSLGQVARYRTFSNTIKNLQTAILENKMDMILDPETYVRQMAERFKGYTTYWNGLAKYFGNTDLPAYVDRNIEDSLCTKEQLSGLALVTTINNSTVAKNMQRAEQMYKNKDADYRIILADIDSCRNAISYSHDLIRRFENEIAALQGRIGSSRRDISQNEQRIITRTKDQADVEKVVEPLKQRFNETEAEFKAFAAQLLSSENKELANVIEQFKKLDVAIADIRYMVDGREHSIKKKPELAYSSSAKLTRVCFYTLKPNIIYLNRREMGNDAPQAVGGPYYVEIIGGGGSAQMNLNLYRRDAIFGLDDSTVWPHPHTPGYGFDRRNMESFFEALTTPQSCCLGEGLPMFVAGFKSNDPRSIVYSALAYLSSANSINDVWGQRHKLFPKPGETHVFNPKPVTPEPATETVELAQQTEATLDLEEDPDLATLEQLAAEAEAEAILQETHP